MMNWPNILTFSRIVIIPVLVGAFYLDDPWDNWTTFLLFVYAGITDFFDGYLARSLGQFSKLGRFLDPIADKLLVAAVLLMLVAFGTINGITVLAAVIILCRELLVSGLREFLAELKVGVPVTKLAKWKTTVQLVAIGALLWGDAAPFHLPAMEVGIIGLWIAAVLTLVTGYDYLRAGMRHLSEEPAKSE